MDEEDVLKLGRFPNYKEALIKRVHEKLGGPNFEALKQRLEEAMKKVLAVLVLQPLQVRNDRMEFPIDVTSAVSPCTLVLAELLTCFEQEKITMIGEAFEQEEEAVHQERVDICEQMRSCDEAFQRLEEMHRDHQKGSGTSKDLAVTVLPGFSMRLCQSLSWPGRCKTFMEEQMNWKEEEERRKQEEEEERRMKEAEAPDMVIASL